MLSAFALSQILVGVALILNLFSFQFKSRSVVVVLLSISTILVAGQLYFLGQIAPALLVLYAVFYFLVSLKTTDKKIMLLFMFGSIGIFIFRYAVWLDWLMLTSSFLTLLSLYNSNQKRMREFQFVGTGIRIVYYIFLYSPVGILLEVTLLFSNLTGYWRFYMKRPSNQNLASVDKF